jgi:glycerate-2-kinase
VLAFGVRAILERWFVDAVDRARPDRLVEAALAPRAATLRGATVLALGKAAGPMAEAARRVLGEAIAAQVCVVPDGAVAPPGALVAGHPEPDGRSLAAAHALLAAAARARGAVVALISGGGSALAELPAPGLALDDLVETIGQLTAAGAPITELNCVRRQLSAIKGGRLALASPAPVLTLAVSDVVGDRPCDIASGPTVPDPTSAADARIVIERRLRGRVGAAVAARLARPAGDDVGLVAPRPGDEAVLLAGRRALVDAALAVGAAAGHEPVGWPAPLDGAVDEVADLLAGWLAHGGDRAVVAGGEPTVVLPAAPGRGGRAQQLALEVARRIAGQAGVGFLAAGSDGVDGAGPAAGAVVDGASWAAIRAAGLDPDACLARCDAAAALEAIGATIMTGPTGVNHADLMLALRAR